MEEPSRVSFRDSRFASRKAEEASSRRFQAAAWLESLVGPLGLSSHPSQQEFISCLRSGIVLCNAINKIQPGAVPKVVTRQSAGLVLEIQPLPAYQYFENIRNFLVAVEELKLPSFEASDLERDTLEAGSAAKIVDCILALKAYSEWNQSSGRSGGPWKHMKSPLAPQSASRIQLNGISLGSSVRKLDLSTISEKKQSPQNDDKKDADKVGSLVRALSGCMFNSKENIDQNLLDSWREGTLDSAKLFSKIMSTCLQEHEWRTILKDMSMERNTQSDNLSTTQPQKCCNLCLQKEGCNHWNLVKDQENELSELKALLSRTKMEFIALQSQLQDDLTQLGSQIQGLSAASRGYHQAVKENRHLYNVLQELKGNIRVFCRIRPCLHLDARSSIDYIGKDGSLMIIDPIKPQNTRRTFQFNKVFGPIASQEEVYKDTQSLVRSVMDGYNVCIFAYGQTGSGKTHTMCGRPNGSAKDMGINYMALNDLFEISCTRRDVQYEIKIQMVEIYNEQVRDLFSEDTLTSKLEIRNCSGIGGLSLPDATMHMVQSTADVLNLMNMGEKNRAFSSTAMNDRSSRSHSVLTVHVQGKDVTGSMLHSCLHLVDLAGSERVDKSEVTGDRLKEAQHINRSLACLGDVISALAQKNSHIPYRNSKLTQLLQNSLGGHAKMLMFAHVSPEGDFYGETVSTLKFAQRVSTVELGAAHINKESSEVRQLKEEIDNLKKALVSKEGEKILPPQTLERSKYTTDHTPPRSRRLSIENCSVRKIGAATNPDDKKALVSKEGEKILPPQTSERSKYTTDHTPPRSRRLSIENCSARKIGGATNPDDKKTIKSPLERTPPRPQRLSTENSTVTKIPSAANPDDLKALKSPLARPKLGTDTPSTAPACTQRLSLEGSTREKNQQEFTTMNHATDTPGRMLKENVFCRQLPQEDGLGVKPRSYNETGLVVSTEDSCHISPTTRNLSRHSQLLNLESGFSNRKPLQQPETPDLTIKLNAVVMTPDAYKQSKKSINANTSSSKGSQIRKSLQTIGKFINGSERRVNQCPPEITPPSAYYVKDNHGVKSPITVDASAQRRQSLINMQPLGSGISRRSSLGGKSTDAYSADIQSARTKTPPPIHQSASKVTKRWL